MEKFQNKYRIPSARLQNWDYAWNAAYFVTICTQGRVCYFGNILNGEMQLSEIGILANRFWHDIKLHVRNVDLGEFIVMPNHVHGILILNDNTLETTHALSNHENNSHTLETTHALFNHENNSHTLETTHALSLHDKTTQQQTIGQKRFQHQGKNSISSIVGSYKSAVSKHSHILGLHFAWQSRFHDHIIRDDKSFNKISDYIHNNPLYWDADKFNPLKINSKP